MDCSEKGQGAVANLPDDCPELSAVARDIPVDSLVEILARIPVRSVCRSKCVAKGWRDLIEDPLHGKKIPQTLQGFFSINLRVRRGSGGAHVGFTSLRARSAPLGIDRCLSFLTELPGTKILTLADSCNGLLLFKHGPKSGPSDGLGHIVCNPATKHWVSVPRHDGFPPPPFVIDESRYAYLVFDSAVSSHFHIVQFWFELYQVMGIRLAPVDDSTGEIPSDDDEGKLEPIGYRLSVSVHVYSSEIGTWSYIKNDSMRELGQLEEWHHRCLPYGFIPRQGPGCAVLNAELHFIISCRERDQDLIVAVDVQGETQRIIPLPATATRKPGYVAQSQGHLHYISQASNAQLSIWVLEDTQTWVLKDSVSFVELFGQRRCSGNKNKYRVVAMHPDGNVVFIVQNLKLISYDMDHKLVNVIATLENNIAAKHIVPYVPCFLVLPALTNKH